MLHRLYLSRFHFFFAPCRAAVFLLCRDSTKCRHVAMWRLLFFSSFPHPRIHRGSRIFCGCQSIPHGRIPLGHTRRRHRPPQTTTTTQHHPCRLDPVLLLAVACGLAFRGRLGKKKKFFFFAAHSRTHTTTLRSSTLARFGARVSGLEKETPFQTTFLQKESPNAVWMLCRCAKTSQKHTQRYSDEPPLRYPKTKTANTSSDLSAPLLFAATPASQHRNLAEQKPVPKRRRASRNFSHKHKVNGDNVSENLTFSTTIINVEHKKQNNTTTHDHHLTR